jgi:hypothetical protein
MLHRHLPRRTLRAASWLVALGVLASAGPSEARENRACVNAYRRGAQLAREAHFFAATEQMRLCTKLICSPALRKECMSRVDQLTLDTPSLVPEVTDDRGRPVVDIRITMDGKPWVNRLDGRAIPVDPGQHTFTFETRGVVFAKERIVVLQGQRNRTLSAALVWERGRDEDPAEDLATGPAPAVVAATRARSTRMAPPPPQPMLAKDPEPLPEPIIESPTPSPALSMASAGQGARGLPRALQEPAGGPVRPRALDDGGDDTFSAAPYLTAGIGVAGLAGYGLLTYWGLRDNRQLENCAPMCPESSVAHIKRLYLAANVSAGVGAAALATWAYLVFFASPGSDRASASQPALGFGVQPLGGGGFAAVSGSF